MCRYTCCAVDALLKSTLTCMMQNSSVMPMWH